MSFPIEALRELVGSGNELTLKFVFGTSPMVPTKVIVQPSIKTPGVAGSAEAQAIDAALSSPLVIEGTEAELSQGLVAAVQAYRTTRDSLGGLRTNLQELEAAEKQARANVANKASRKTKPGPGASPTAHTSSDEDDDGGEPAGAPGPSATPEQRPSPARAQPAGNPMTLF